MNTRLPSFETVFAEALEIPSASERAAYLERACAGDEGLRRQVETLLKAHDRAGRFLEPPDFAATADRLRPVEGPGTVIGPYKLMEQIGEGGMGAVYVAEQHEPVRRKVALKIIKPGMDSRQVVARFEAERQALAMMDHPNIAKVHDGGTTESGRPYFVMELVRGLPITHYCDQEQLSIRERLQLFELVCRAVQHAHQKGVIHRDIKPSNVLITLHDGVPVPKIIDFGVAKATGQALTEKTIYTAFTQLIGTPLYMSPEQVELSGLDVDTRSDIYSLGVLLYELLTGTTPFDQETLRKAAFDEMRRIIREEEPPRPSTRLSTLGESLSTVSARRKSDPRRLAPSMRGELDWIVMKALEKDRRRRYETANDFASDVMRYLTDQPVEACPPSAWYRLRKLARRNRVALTTAALLASALVLGATVSTWQAVRAARAERRADVRSRLARRAVDEMYTEVAEKWLARQATLTPLQRAFLDKAVAFYDQFAAERASDPEARLETARAEWRVGEIRRKLGQHKEAEVAYRHSLRRLEDLDRVTLDQPGSRLDLARVRSSLGLLLFDTGRLPEAERELRLALGLCQSLADGHPDAPAYCVELAKGHENLAATLARSGRSADAVATYRQAIRLREGLLGHTTDDRDLRLGLAVDWRLLAGLAGEGEAEAAEADLRRSVDALEKLVADAPDVPEYRVELASGYFSLSGRIANSNRTGQADSFLRKALDHYEKLAAEFPQVPGHRHALAQALNNLSIRLGGPGWSEEAERVQLRASEIRQALANDFPDVPDYQMDLGGSLNNRALVLEDRGELTEARRLLEQAVDCQKAALRVNPGHPAYRRFHRLTLMNLLRVLMRLGPTSAEGGGQETQPREAVAPEYVTRVKQLAGEVFEWGKDDDGTMYSLAEWLSVAPVHEVRDPVLALEAARRAVELDPKGRAGLKILALAQFRAGDWNAAFEALSKIPEVEKSDYGYLRILLALIHARRGETEQASRDYDFAVAWMEREVGRLEPGTVPLQREAAALLGRPDTVKLAEKTGLATGKVRPSMTMFAPLKAVTPVADGTVGADEYGPALDVNFVGDGNPGRLWSRGTARSKALDDLSYRFAAAHTTSALFLAVEVRDQTLKVDETGKLPPSLGDLVHVHINGDQVANDIVPPGRNYSGEGFQLYANAVGNKGGFSTDDWKVGTSRQPGGYVIEFEIPLRLIDVQDGLGETVAKTGDLLLINLSVEDVDTDGDARDYGILWADDPSLLPWHSGESFWTVGLQLTP
jgi:serine/threonine protein kinase